MALLMITLAIPLFIGQVVPSEPDINRKAMQHNLEVCPKGMWKIASLDEHPGIWHGNTLLEFQLPAAKPISMRYEAILACEGIVINGTGHQILKAKKDETKVAQFRLHLPVPKDGNETLYYDNDLNHTCTFELRDLSKVTKAHKSVIRQCNILVRTYMSRILPSCDYEKSKELIEEIVVSKEQGQVQIYLKHSSNDVVTVDHDCHVHNMLGHNRSKAMEDGVFPLRPPGEQNTAMLITFYPNCEMFNETVRKYYSKERMDDCHLEVFSFCQDGVISLNEMKIDIDDDAMLCHPPKPSYVEVLESMELKFQIESMPVVGLLFLLFVNGGLYLAISPLAIIKLVKYTSNKLRKAAAKSKKAKRDDQPSQEGMECDEVQLSLFDKLSSDDIRQSTQDLSAKETIVTQVELHPDTEVVQNQPMKAEETMLEYSQSKRKKSADKRKRPKNQKDTSHHSNKKKTKEVKESKRDHKKHTDRKKEAEGDTKHSKRHKKHTGGQSDKKAAEPVPAIPPPPPPPPLPNNKRRSPATKKQ